MKLMSQLCKLENFIGIFKDPASLIARLWIARIFFNSGMSKLTDWGATIVLFKYNYSVPLLSPITAAYLGTAAELVLPILLVLGLGGRITIGILFIYNIICVVSYPFLWLPAHYSGLRLHINWGIILMLLMSYGPGRISLDYLLKKYCCR